MCIRPKHLKLGENHIVTICLMINPFECGRLWWKLCKNTFAEFSLAFTEWWEVQIDSKMQFLCVLCFVLLSFDWCGVWLGRLYFQTEKFLKFQLFQNFVHCMTRSLALLNFEKFRQFQLFQNFVYVWLDRLYFETFIEGIILKSMYWMHMCFAQFPRFPACNAIGIRFRVSVYIADIRLGYYYDVAAA